MSNRHRIPFISIILALLGGACENQGLVGLGDSAGSGDVLMTDTITVTVSTVYAGPVPTTGTNEQLVGSYHDDRFGKVLCRSYFSIRPGSSDFALNKDVVFDSLRHGREPSGSRSVTGAISSPDAAPVSGSTTFGSWIRTDMRNKNSDNRQKLRFRHANGSYSGNRLSSMAGMILRAFW